MAASRNRKNSPYLSVGTALCIVAVVLVIAIFVLALRDDPSPDPAVSSQPPTSQPPASVPSESTQSSLPVFETSSDTSFTIPIDESEESSSDASVPDVFRGQPASAVAYEQKIGVPYAIDLNPYESYICPENAMQYVFLVNPTHTLAADYTPNDLVNIKYMRANRPSYYSQLRACAEKALEAFIEEANLYCRANGIAEVTVSNGFRSYNVQKSLFENYCAEERSKHPDWSEEEVVREVLTYSTRPGTSEHQSGLCVDMHNQISTDLSFANTPAALWLEENCYRFGFVLRYPEDKQDITGIIFEPWHFRFVGRDAATEMHELGMCLEEYCAYKGIA